MINVSFTVLGTKDGRAFREDCQTVAAASGILVGLRESATILCQFSGEPVVVLKHKDRFGNISIPYPEFNARLRALGIK